MKAVEIYLDTAVVQIVYYINWYMGKSCESEEEKDKWELDTEGELVEFFNEFSNMMYFNFISKLNLPYHGTRKEISDWLTKLKLIAKGNN